MTPPDFHEPVAGQHRHLDVAEWDDVYVVGDVHGCRRELDRLLSRLGVTDDDLVVFVGDLVRKGPDSAGVLELVRGSPNLVSVRGNNEEKLLRGTKHLESLSAADMAYLEEMPVAVTVGDTLVVHGGVDPRMPLSAHTVDDLETTRSLVPNGSYDRPFWFEEYGGPRRVFFGHTVLERPIVRPDAVGLDTGCVYGGALTAYDWRTGDLVSVPGREIQSRPDSKFVSPLPMTA
jgi:serine/threonine protein phosphatase 1